MKQLTLIALVLAIAIPCRASEKQAANQMAAAANNLLSALDTKQKAATAFALTDDHRLNWHFIPMDRKGLTLKEMNPEQRHLTTALLASALSSQGLIKANTIMSLEAILRELEGPNRRFPRDPEMYHISIFGEPGPGKTWGWRYEGHHLSLSFTVVKGEFVSATPSMMGTNPDIVMEGPRKGLQVLADEENVGLKLAKSLSATQREKVIFSEKAPSDIVTSNKRKVSPLEPQGINWKDLTDDQKGMVWNLVKTYVRRARGDIADVDEERITDAGRDNIHFAWAGGMEHGQGHYYRIQGPTFLIEYDNTQNNANHIHAVYRDFAEDFGEDLLTKHYKESHN